MTPQKLSFSHIANLLYLKRKGALATTTVLYHYLFKFVIAILFEIKIILFVVLESNMMNYNKVLLRISTTENLHSNKMLCFSSKKYKIIKR